LFFVLERFLVLEIKSNPKNKNKETRTTTFIMNKITTNLSNHHTKNE